MIEQEQGPLELDVLLATHNAFAASVLDGMVVHALQIGEQSGIQLLGPGDLLFQNGALSPPWLDGVEFRSVGPMRLALLGDGFLAVSRRVPRVTSALYQCIGEQMQRVTGQLVICQLPRVDQRVLAILWLLAESWGQVTPGGVRLPLALTHETLGAMIGARRPTVTLALRKLSEEGSIVHQDSGWLLLEPPPEPAAIGKVPRPSSSASRSRGGSAARADARSQRRLRRPGGNRPPAPRATHAQPSADPRPVTADPERSGAHERHARADLSGRPTRRRPPSS